MRPTTPTRQTLHRLEDRIEFAERGRDVLERKLEALVFEFGDVLDQYESTRSDLDKAYATAQSELDHVRAVEGDIELRGIARARKHHPTMTTASKNLMGVRVPLFEPRDITVDITEHGYGLVGTSPVVDEVVDAYEALLEQVVVAAEVATALRILLDEIGTTRHRVNALEKAVLPDLRAEASYIRRHLAERERDERVRQKWFKSGGGGTQRRRGRGRLQRRRAGGDEQPDGRRGD
ncbi:V-type ATP synthase subunit D [Haloglomus litoreum]|uniref:V-type ATP synthase subunit D n=1 Tax=Haloglomus litoreum TaxID=3034026 RepID=UPI0023E8A635|nr:V-type ATP synthase subunit D [Haloglomus sp. DT116]